MLNKGKKISLLLFILLPCIVLGERLPSVRHYTVSDGLVQHQVTSLYQDNEGYLWIGSRIGLSRFDGVDFENFFRQDGLNSDFIHTITESPGGDVFVFTSEGISKFTDNHFESIPFDLDFRPQKWGDSGFFFEALGEDWFFISDPFTDMDGILFKNGEVFNLDVLFPGMKDVKVVEASFDKNRKNFLFYNEEGLFFYKNNSIHLIREFSNYNKGVVGFVPVENNRIGFVSTEGIIIFRKDDFLPLQQIDIHNPEKIKSLRFIDDHNYCYHVSNSNYLSILEMESKDTINSFSMQVPSIFDIKNDREGNVWMITDIGVMVMLNHALTNQSIDFDTTGYIYDVIQDNDKNIFMSTSKGSLWKYNNGDFEKVRIFYPDGSSEYTGYLAENSFVDARNTVWLPAQEGLVYLKNGVGRVYPDIPGQSITAAFENPFDSLKYFAQNNNLYIIDQNDNLTSSMQVFPGNKPGFINSVNADKYGNLWIAGQNGISILKGKELIHLPNDSIDLNIGGNVMVSDHNDNLWIGGADGLFFYDYNKTVQKIESAALSGYVKELKSVDSTGLFVGMVGAIAYLDIQQFFKEDTLIFQYYDQSNGFLGMEVQENGSCLLSDGTILMACTDMLVHFDPAKNHLTNIADPYLRLTGVNFLDNDLRWQKASLVKHPSNQKVHFRNSQKNLQFQFKAITMNAGQKIKYRYKIEGLNNDWLQPTSERNANFTFLPPGDYTFTVNASNNLGQWTDNSTNFGFTILPPWWRNPVMIMLGVIAILFLIGLIVYLLVEKIKGEKVKKIRNQKRIAELKLEAIRSQIEPHFIFNIMNTLGSSIFKGDPVQAYSTLTKFAKLIRQSIENNNKSYTSIDMEIDFVKSYLDLQSQRFNNQFTYYINRGATVPGYLCIPRLLIQNLVENALKHGIAGLKEGGEIKVDLKMINDNLIIMVEDNGVGRRIASKRKDNNTGIGLSVNQELLDIYNQYNKEKIELKIIDLFEDETHAKPSGTRVWVKIPSSYSYDLLDDAANISKSEKNNL